MNPQKTTAAGFRSTFEGAARACALLLAALCGCVTAAAQTTDFVELASPDAAGTNGGNAGSSLPRTSADGRFVVFQSDASDLVANDANGKTDVFVRDLQTDTTRLVSVNAAGTGTGNNLSLVNSITPDGRFVLFGSAASDLVANDANGKRDVFVRDLQLNTTTLVSVNSAGAAAGDGDSFPAFLTPDGRFAVFNSAASDLVAGVAVVSQKDNVFRRDLQAGTTVMVSVNPAGTSGGNGHSAAQGVTPDGRFVLFHSSASGLTANDTNGFSSDIFRRDLQTGTTALASVNSAGTGGGNEGANSGVISDDGRVVAFSSNSTDLVPHPGPGKGFTVTSIYEHDFVANTTTLVSEPQVFQGVATVPPARLPRISADGRYIFYLRYENFVGGLNRAGFRDRVFRRDRQTGELLELPFVASGLCDQGFNCRSIINGYVTSPDGRYVAYAQLEQSRVNPTPYSTAIIIRDMTGGGVEVVNGLPGVPFTMPGEVPRILTPGNLVAGGKLAFSSGVAHAAADTNSAEDVYLFAPPAENRLAFTVSNYGVTEDGVVGFMQGVRVRRSGYLNGSTVTVKFSTSDGTATAGSDYVARSETLSFAPGETEKVLPIQIINEEEVEPTPETINLTLSDPTGDAVLGSPSAATLTVNDDDPHFFQLGAEFYDVEERFDSSVLVTVTMSGTSTQTLSVAYSTSDGTASERSDYTTARGRLTFAPGETSKTFRVLVVDDGFVEGVETLNLSLSDPRGAGAVIGTTRATSQIRITSNDDAAPTVNSIDMTNFFVRQHYYDFLNRPPDADGFQFWSDEINNCINAPDIQCFEIKRVNVSAAFFLSIEFQTTGYLAYLTNRAAFGARPSYAQFMYELQNLQKNFVFGQPGAPAQLEANRRAYFDEFVTRTAFVFKFGGKSDSDYVNTLLTENGLAPTVGNLFVSRLDGGQVVPPTASGATGVVIVRRDPTGASLVANVSLSLKNLSGAPTAVHIHGPAATDANAPALHTLPAGEFADFQLALTDEQTNLLNTGQLYIDVHTTNFPDGEIRARLGPARFRADVLTSALTNQILTRAQVLRVVAESDELRRAELNRAFVLMEYFGYLRRDPDEDGYNFWLSKLNEAGGDYVRAEMVKAFINSAEYRQRFGP
ncbi:MAG TPA: Calx-beta domain-containing protein [Pyrinomonadaceae bacterium]|jgi:hypothetical protein